MSTDAREPVDEPLAICVVCHRPVMPDGDGMTSTHNHPPPARAVCPGSGLEPVLRPPPSRRMRLGTLCDVDGRLTWRPGDADACSGPSWPVVVDIGPGDVARLPAWAEPHEPGFRDAPVDMVAELVGDLADTPEPPASLVRAVRYLGVPARPPASCCDRAYFCFVSVDFECAAHGGFDVCCDRPHWHRTSPYRPDGHQRGS